RLPIKRHVNNDEASNSTVDVGRIDAGKLFAKVSVIILNMLRRVLRKLLTVKDRPQGLLIVTTEHQLLLPFTFLLDVLEEVRVNALRRRVVFTASPVDFANMIA